MLTEEEICNILSPIEEFFQELGVEIINIHTVELYKQHTIPKSTNSPITKEILEIFIEIKYGITYFELGHHYDILDEQLKHWDIIHSYYTKDVIELKKHILQGKSVGHQGYRINLDELWPIIKYYSITEHQRVSNVTVI